MPKNKELFRDLLKQADIEINGTRPWDIIVNDDKLFDNILLDGTIAFGEGYMTRLWDCERIDILISKLLRSNIEDKLSGIDKVKFAANYGVTKLKSLINHQAVNRVKEDVPFHYDIGNDLFVNMLDERMAYTCAYWKDAKTLDQAQEHKMDLICRKLNLQPGMRLLDIGCGWASFMNYAAAKYGVICDGLTLSKEQMALGQEIANKKKLPVKIILQDYREFTPEQPYDRVVSIGMIEHVGPSNYDEYFKCANSFLTDEGVFLLHTIGSPTSKNGTDPWINKYIFPNGVIPSLSQLSSSVENQFNIEDVHNFGPDYDLTLMAWCEKFEKNWFKIYKNYDATFYRMWRFYLLSCAGAFRCRDISLWQIALTKIGTDLPVNARAA
ncbi:cyclopropane fatty acyl phospholipid synthase [Photobacterium phosphoreum]|uniref:Cyclopropane fatty acyl phospholipid synthase n=1 Tax=Photobacterium phosphoreum TaxID=659 RepID=A0AAW5A5T3_PHOPO|nr:cyclopropane fatty acyl phospholipid synthase [Photobacterium phosphoreum]MCD9493047.1 cyclopropane fatty acyl phospholipid synthase [Photobacterium phosphoreum]MCF2192284.1 cyclopropane fatty acyl phospholipid synthase [Photobacterium phosphoreum]MCF2303926.1 cyclopropane fatty acyl phospholipid synthase [Photobacterium phosphoreum]OBU37498.1 cyclopropane-fatty-acyl-phospholipid synthase [Photobacterium phosphoreum]PSU75439.1 cyclopropane fatty acyl phospholipid synthase [Photobacterium ph